MARIDQNVVRLGHEDGADNEQCLLPFAEPPIPPCARHGKAPQPVWRKVCLVDLHAPDLVGYFEFNEPVPGERGGLADLVVDQYFQQRSRRIRSAIENLVPAGMPTCRSDQPTSTIQRLVLREPPDDHVSRTNRVRYRPAAPLLQEPQIRISGPASGFALQGRTLGCATNRRHIPASR